ncbi:MAG: 5-oxoprolinase subunit PxpB [Chloroflexi bacterium]|nr:5-oxoprolinase subunit PxpB [Chloroflexota bacterium]
MTQSQPRLLPAGDSALLVEFADEISQEINDRVHALAQVLETRALAGVVEVVPTYRSVLVHYSPLKLTYGELREDVAALLTEPAAAAPRTATLVEIPVVYGGEYGPDLASVAELHGLSAAEVVRIHSSATYSVYMLGFILGFAYLGGLDQAIATPRLSTPRTLVPAGSVGIAETQTGIYSVAAPGGWQIIGRTPLTLFDVTQIPPTIVQPGDRIRFVPIAPPA